MSEPTPLAPIPTPAKWPLLGHLLEFEEGKFTQRMLELARTYDGIFELDIMGTRNAVVFGADLVAELADESRFRKIVEPPLADLRELAGDGLFTAHSDEPNWGKAHRILLPAFSLRAMKSYFPQMLDVAQQLVAKWERQQGEDLPVGDDMTRLTLDTIALAGFSYRFRSFERPELDPFLAAMGRVLEEAMERMTRLPILEPFLSARRRQFQSDIAVMHRLVDQVIQERRASGERRSDLLGLMLDATDPETGEQLDDVNVRNQVITFLIAGHETTSGLLTFTLYLLVRNPHVLAQAYAEVDRVLPDDTVPTYQHLAQLDVLDRVLKEALRLWSTAPSFDVAPFEDTMLGGCYRLAKDQAVTVLIPALHRDPRVWDDPERFDIERWTPAAEAERHPHAYKPFGNGVRACIGRQFALVEARLALALIVQRFALADPHDYQLRIKETLTIKPDNFWLRARVRLPQERLVAPVPEAPVTPAPAAAPSLATGMALRVAYGSNMGTAEEIARTLGEQASSAGMQVQVVSLDELARDLPHDELLVIVTATYNGQPPDNARGFAELLASGDLPPNSRSQLRFALLGCGNSQWRTYQVFPRQVETGLLAMGAQPLIPRGEADANGDFDGAVERWLGELWAALAQIGGATVPTAPTGPRYQLELLDETATRPAIVPPHAYPLRVISNNELLGDATGLWDHSVEPPRRSTRHLVLALPASETYATGDHLAVYARNSNELVARVAARLGVAPNQLLRLTQLYGDHSHLPVGEVVTLGRLLSDFVELQDVARRSDIALLIEHTDCPWTQQQLQALIAETDEGQATYQAEILAKRVSLFDLLVRFPAITLPLELFLEHCGPIRPRYYSISSAALATPRQLSLTVGVVHEPAWSGTGQYKGLASSYLAGLQPGDTVFGFVRTPNPPFAPPADPTTPLILIGPGTGIAPLRGFVEERAHQRAAGSATGPTLLFVGCRHPDHDWYYRTEFEYWAAESVVTIRAAFSQLADYPYRYVQDALVAWGAEVWELVAAGAAIYVCGDGIRMAPAVRQAFGTIYQQHTATSEHEAEQWLADLDATGRYRQDVFGPSK